MLSTVRHCRCSWLLLLLLLPLLLPAGCGASRNAGNISCYECNVFRVETGRQVQCQEYRENPETQTKDWIVVPISSGRIPLTRKQCAACGTYVAWSNNHFRKPRGQDESQVTLVVSRFCVEGNAEPRARSAGCIDNIGSHSYLRRCFCHEDACNSYDAWDMMKFGP